jgi:hypothetical protein
MALQKETRALAGACGGFSPIKTAVSPRAGGITPTKPQEPRNYSGGCPVCRPTRETGPHESEDIVINKIAEGMRYEA